MKHYEIHGSHMVKDKNWRANEMCHVVAESAQRAIELVLDRYPNLEIWSLQHKGRVDIIDERTAQTCEEKP